MPRQKAMPQQNRSDHLREVADKYLAVHPEERLALDLRSLVKWAKRKKLWSMEPSKEDAVGVREFQGALTQSIVIDPQGREQRMWGCVPILNEKKQGEFWFKIKGAPRELVFRFYYKLFTHCNHNYRKVRDYVESWNQNERPAGEEPIQLDFTDPLRYADEQQDPEVR